uniref:Putative ovule protein n=1 Tax=Solanum chacoense TaxID=4108 RepID=A0A0V0HUD2_SOLCH
MEWWDGLYDMYNIYQAEKAQGSFAEVLPKPFKAKFIFSRDYANLNASFFKILRLQRLLTMRYIISLLIYQPLLLWHWPSTRRHLRVN